MVWSHNDSWMVTGDHGGYVKYWQSNMNNVKMYQAHKEAIRGIRYSHLIAIVNCIYHFVAADASQPSQSQRQRQKQKQSQNPNRIERLVRIASVVLLVWGIIGLLASLVDRYISGLLQSQSIKPSIQQQATNRLALNFFLGLRLAF